MPDSLTLSRAAASDFNPLIDSEFSIALDDGQTRIVTLTNVQTMKAALAGKREPFTLTFSGGPGVPLPQRIYRFTHPDIGDLEIFIVPVAATAQATTYEAIFS